jgi:3-deoxy-D-manno-octulosonic-acid transferase|tara:strand:- start:398 stop:946 length:549 start_codon:yes stop_codon:yes gene_type:complete
LYTAYVALSMLLLPFVARSAIKKLRAADVPVLHTHERLGTASEDRPNGTLIWLHTASANESLSVLALITRMGVMLPDAHFLITSSCATSATRIAQRMPPRTVHQFAPLDAAGPLKRFLKHWRPKAAIFVAYDLWPQMLCRTRATGTTMALVNPQMSAQSQTFFAKVPKLAAYILATFDLILA